MGYFGVGALQLSVRLSDDKSKKIQKRNSEQMPFPEELSIVYPFQAQLG